MQTHSWTVPKDKITSIQLRSGGRRNTEKKKIKGRKKGKGLKKKTLSDIKKKVELLLFCFNSFNYNERKDEEKKSSPSLP